MGEAPEGAIVRSCGHIAEKGLFAIILFLPVTVLPDAHWPFDIPKVTLLRVLTILMLAAWLARGIALRELRLARPPLMWPILFYGVTYAVATPFSISHTLSLFGGDGKTLGLVSLVNIILLYFLLFNIMTQREQLIRCLQLMVVSATVVAGVGIWQWYADPSPGSTLMVLVPGRVSATFGNPDFLLSFIVLMIPIVAAFLIQRRWLYALPAFLLLLCLVLSMPSLFGTIPDLLIALGVLALLYGTVALARTRGMAWAALPLLALLLGAGTAVGVSEKASDYLERHVAGQDSRRSELVRTAMRSVPDYPIVGSGPNTFRDTFLRYRSLEDTQARPDRGEEKVHNSFVESLATTGVLGLLGYVVALAALGWYMLRWLRRSQGNRDWLLVAMIGVAGILYIGQSMVNFHTTTPYLFFWLVMAIGVGLSMPNGSRFVVIPLKLPKAVIAVLALIIIASAGLGVAGAMRPLSADYFFDRAHDVRVADRFPVSEAIRDYERAIDWYGAEARYYQDYVTALDVVRRQAQAAGDSVTEAETCRKMVWAFDELVDLEPRNGLFYAWRAETAANCAAAQVSTDRIQDDVEKALKCYPYSYLAWRLQGGLRLLAEDFPAAVKAYRNSLTIKPNQALTHYRLGLALEQMGELEAARRHYEEALQLDPDLAVAQEGLDRL